MTYDELQEFMNVIEDELEIELQGFVYLPFPDQTLADKHASYPGAFEDATEFGKQLMKMGYTVRVFEGNEALPTGVLVDRTKNTGMKVYHNKYDKKLFEKKYVFKDLAKENFAYTDAPVNLFDDP